MVEISSSGRERILWTMDFRVSLLMVEDGEGRNLEVRMGMLVKRDSISERGFQPTNTSNFPRATAISGLWFASPNFSGSCSWSLAASFLSGCI